MAGLRQLCNYDLFKPSLDFGVQLENTLRTIWRPSTIKMLIRPHSSIWAWNDNILCKSVTKGGDLTTPWVLVCLGTVWYSICSKHLKATLRFLSKCLRTDTAFLIKKYKSFLQWPSTANVQGYQTLARMRKSKCAVDLVHELPSSMLSNCEHRNGPWNWAFNHRPFYPFCCIMQVVSGYINIQQQWHCYGIAMALLSHCYGIAMQLLG